MQEHKVDSYVFAVRHFHGIKEINYLMTLDDFKAAFAVETRTDFFSSHNKDLDWQFFCDELNTQGSAGWAVSNNDTFTVYKIRGRALLHGFLRGDFNEDIADLVLLNRDGYDSIIEAMESYLDIYWEFDLKLSTPEVVAYAKTTFPGLVNEDAHGLSFEELFERIKPELTEPERLMCLDYIQALKGAQPWKKTKLYS